MIMELSIHDPKENLQVTVYVTPRLKKSIIHKPNVIIDLLTRWRDTSNLSVTSDKVEEGFELIEAKANKRNLFYQSAAPSINVME